MPTKEKRKQKKLREDRKKVVAEVLNRRFCELQTEKNRLQEANNIILAERNILIERIDSRISRQMLREMYIEEDTTEEEMKEIKEEEEEEIIEEEEEMKEKEVDW
ncbi:3034_t:CDS:2 [Racocetra fulgida]|uniref:3034_t:CDS:1 n=1 Tax=Racocetra fulgida TaxID=60492 RepID=A0A9N9FHV9_9GLOM|nr:3034_t:CDS:2 [Racocetra fulgida]